MLSQLSRTPLPLMAQRMMTCAEATLPIADFGKAADIAAALGAASQGAVLNTRRVSATRAPGLPPASHLMGMLISAPPTGWPSTVIGRITNRLVMARAAPAYPCPPGCSLVAVQRSIKP